MSVKSIRSKLSSRQKLRVLKRDQFTCCSCRAKGSDSVPLEIDHKVPVSKGGDNHIGNLQTLCASCNRKKAAGQLTTQSALSAGGMAFIEGWGSDYDNRYGSYSGEIIEQDADFVLIEYYDPMRFVAIGESHFSGRREYKSKAWLRSPNVKLFSDGQALWDWLDEQFRRNQVKYRAAEEGEQKLFSDKVEQTVTTQ